MTRRERKNKVIEMPGIDAFSSRLNEAIREAKTNKFQMASDGVCSNNTLGYYAKGRNYPNVANLVAICEYLDVSSDWLLGLSDEKRRR